MYIKVRVKTKARKEEIIQENSDHFVVSIKEPAVRNMANKRILEIFRDTFPGRNVRIISGHHHPSKMLAVDDE